MGKKEILITGANGLLGNHSVQLFNTKYKVHAIVRELPDEEMEGVTYHVKDFKTDWSTESLPREIHTIFHLAQSDLFRSFPDNAVEVFNVNVTSTVKLLDYGRQIKIKKFVFASTGGIYNSSIDALSENSPINTFGLLGNYFATKLCSEILTHNYTNYFDVTLLRLFFMYGKGQKRSMLIPRLVDSIRDGKPVILTANDGIQINPVHVSDVVHLLDNLIHSTGSYTFNVAGSEILTLKEIAEIIGEKMRIQPLFEHKSEIGDNWIANTDHLKDLIYIPTVRFEDKIFELI